MERESQFGVVGIRDPITHEVVRNVALYAARDASAQDVEDKQIAEIASMLVSKFAAYM